MGHIMQTLFCDSSCNCSQMCFFIDLLQSIKVSAVFLTMLYNALFLILPVLFINNRASLIKSLPSHECRMSVWCLNQTGSCVWIHLLYVGQLNQIVTFIRMEYQTPNIKYIFFYILMWRCWRSITFAHMGVEV